MAGVVADRVIVELEAKLDRYDANVRRAEARFTTATRNIERQAVQVERAMQRSTGAIGNQLRGLATTFAAAFSVQQVAQLADGYTRFTNQLKVAGLEGERLADKQNELFAISQRYGVSLESLGGLYARVAQSSKELGASNAELIALTEGAAAGFKVQGAGVAQSAQATLGLVQALGSAVVHAEEFNQINDAAPVLLRAVAENIAAAGGSVSRLRALVIDGKVTNDEFFRAFLAGSEKLKATAAETSLTIGNSFTILNNALGKYIGETDASLSATERISQAIIALSNNLDTVVKALAVIATIMGARWISAMVAAAGATGAVSTAIFAMQARAIGAATTMEALALTSATAGRAMLAAFGGPVGIAVAALAAGIYYLATANDAAYEASAQYQALEAQGVDIRKRARDAADALATATGKARVEALANAEAIRQETIQYLASARAALVAARAKARAANIEANSGITAPSGYVGAQNPLRVLQYITGTGSVGAAARANADVKAAEQAYKDAKAELAALDKAMAAPPPVRTVAPTKEKKPKKAPKGPKPKDPDEIARRFTDDLEAATVEYQRAMADVTGTLLARQEAERAAIIAERDSRARAIKADKDLDDTQKQKLLVLNDQIAQARIEAQAAEERRRLAEDATNLATADIDNRREILDGQLALATTTAERKDLELRLLDLQQQEERIRLEAIEANTTLRDAEREAARRRLAQLDEMYGAKREGVEKQYQGPGADYLDSLKSLDINEELERIQVEGLKGLEEQLTTTIAKVFELGGVFGQVANQIIADLIRIAVQKAIIGPLANALFGSGEGLGGLLGGIFGGGGSAPTSTPPIVGPRASGGHVNAGQLYQVNENGIEGFQPAGSGKIIPLGQMNSAMQGGPTYVMQRFVLDARGGITTTELLRHVNRVATVQAARAGQASFEASQKALPKRFGEFSKLGT